MAKKKKSRLLANKMKNKPRHQTNKMKNKPRPQTNKAKNKSKLASAILILFLIALIAFFWFGRSWKQEIEMHLTVANYTGINVATDAIYFGALMPGSSSTRTLLVENMLNRTLKCSIVAQGELAGWIDFSQTQFELGIGENKAVNVSVRVPDNAAFGNYTGKAALSFRKK